MPQSFVRLQSRRHRAVIDDDEIRRLAEELLQSRTQSHDAKFYVKGRSLTVKRSSLQGEYGITAIVSSCKEPILVIQLKGNPIEDVESVEIIYPRLERIDEDLLDLGGERK